MANTAIYQNLLRPPKSVEEYDAEFQDNALKRVQAAASMQTLQQNMLDRRQKTADDAELRAAYKSMPAGGTVAQRIQALQATGTPGAMKLAQEMAKEASTQALQDAQTGQAAAHAGLYKSQTTAADQTAGIAAWHDHVQKSVTVQTPEQMSSWVEDGIRVLPKAQGEYLANVMRGLPDGGMAMLPMLRKSVVPLDTQYKEGESTARNTATNAQSGANNAATVGATLAGQRSTAATAAAGRAQADRHFNTTQSAPQEVTDLSTGKLVLVTRDKAGNLTPVEGYGPKAGKGAGGSMTAQQEAKYRTQIAKDYQNANTVLSNMDDLAGSAAAVKSSKGLSGATGLQSYFPSLPDSEASQAQVRLTNLEGKVTSLGKAAAAMSGAIGPMAVQEWKIVRDMVAAIEPQKGEKGLLEQIGLIENAAEGAAMRVRDAYTKHYEADFERYPQFSALAPPRAPGQRTTRPANAAGQPAQRPSSAVDDALKLYGGKP